MNVAVAQDQVETPPAPRVVGHLTLSGTVLSDPHFLQLLGTAAWLCRAVYNAAIDPYVPFAQAVLHELAISRARREGREPPEAPERAEKPLHKARFGALSKELTALIPLIPEMTPYTRSILDEALREACDAVAEHRRRCAQAKRDGTGQPTLHRRRASDGWTVTTSKFKLHRIGDGEPQSRGKAIRAKTKGKGRLLRNRRHRQEERADREVAWAIEKNRCGWSGKRIVAGLDKRAARQDRDRRHNDIRQLVHERDAKDADVARTEARRAERAAAEAEGRGVRRLPPDDVRRDSPRATVGERRMKVDVLGFGYRRVDLGREIPDGAKAVRLQFVKPNRRGAKVEVRLVVTGTGAVPVLDEDAIRAKLVEVANSLPADCSYERAVGAARAAGLKCVGIDFGSANPQCDDQGNKTKPVRWARHDWRAMRAAQAAMTRKEECRRHGGAKPPKGQGKAHVAGPRPPEGGVGERRGDGRRSKKAQRQLDVVRRLCDRAANRSYTRACQDARAVMARKQELVACDPRRMFKPLYAKGGPAETKTKKARAKAKAAKAVEGVEALFGPVTEAVLPELPRWFTPALQRALRRNLHGTRFALRLDRLLALSLERGSVLVTPAHEGTTATCPRCMAYAKKPLSERWHRCPCGLTLPRDQASAVVILGRGILSFRDGPDPDGVRAARLDKEGKTRARREKRQAAMKAGAERVRKERAALAASAGTKPPTPGRGAPGPATPSKRKRVKGQGRNVGRRFPKA